jgi:FkbM family methyltransferase
MKKKIILFVTLILKNMGIGLERYGLLKSYQQSDADIDLILSMPSNKLMSLLPYVKKSRSQLKQDLFVLSELQFKKNGFFVEFGATNGIDLSNTHLLEKEFNWTGILGEPAKSWHKSLGKNRTSLIEHKCIWESSNIELEFNETIDPVYSTISNFNSSDFHASNRKKGSKYKVKTIALLDLLRKYNAPKVIDYLSIDTEGSEYRILKAFDFNQYQFRVITCEHNYHKNRGKIFHLLSSKGYSLKFNGLSKWDDWYVKDSID